MLNLNQINSGWNSHLTTSGVSFQLVTWVVYREVTGKEAPDCWNVIKKGLLEGFATKELALNWAEKNLN